MFNRIILLITIATFTFVSCGDDTIDSMSGETVDLNTWLVPQEEVLDGGPGKDGIPSVDNPKFSTSAETPKFIIDDLVVGIVHNGQARAYPHPILDWHEIVNDEIDDLSVAITYCPLTGTGVGWDRLVNGQTTTFGVSGLLYNSNLMPYDRVTNSTWSQQRLECVNGRLIESTPDIVILTETTLKTWLEAYPDSEIMNNDTGFGRSYGTYPYGDYKTNQERILFPLSNNDNRLPNKERVLGIIMGKESYAVPFNTSNNETEVLQRSLDGMDIVIARNTDKNFIQAFYNPDGLNFEAINEGVGIMIDSNGNTYDLTGHVLDGPNSGTRLEQPVSFIGYWFSWGTFYPEIEIIK